MIDKIKIFFESGQFSGSRGSSDGWGIKITPFAVVLGVTPLGIGFSACSNPCLMLSVDIFRFTLSGDRVLKKGHVLQPQAVYTPTWKTRFFLIIAIPWLNRPQHLWFFMGRRAVQSCLVSTSTFSPELRPPPNPHNLQVLAEYE